MSRMQEFTAQARSEMARLRDAESFGTDVLEEPEQTYLPETDDPELQEALSRLLRAERACDFEGAVEDAEVAARGARPQDKERVASLAAAGSTRHRAAERERTLAALASPWTGQDQDQPRGRAALPARIVDVIREPLPATGAGERRMEVIGYVGVTGPQRSH